jgi:aromatic-L-amino-acid/L-tryptophan decarboxylase
MSDPPVPQRADPRRWPLEPDPAELRRWFDFALERALAHVASLPQQPAIGTPPTPAELAALDEPLPEQGADPRPLIARVVDEWVPRSFTAAGPGYMAYVPGGGLPTAALADLISGLTNRFVGIFAAAPMLARLEMTALRWLLDEFGFPRAARGVFTSGGSIANLIALACARERQLGEKFDDGVLYASDQAHHSLPKAARFLGFPRLRMRLLQSDGACRLPAATVAAAIAEDRARGLRPAVLIASAGTVHTGAIDPLGELADLAQRERLWFHVDGAYGGLFVMTEAGRRRLAGIEGADSLTVDPHKGLFLPYGTGCVLVREGADLRRPHAMASAYLPQQQDDPGVQDSCDLSPELSRDFRGLRVWLSLKTFGAQAFRAALTEKLELARRAEAAIRSIAGLELAAPVDLSLVAFRVARPGDEGDRLTRELLARVNAHRRVYLSGTLLRGRFVMRICVLSFRTHAERLDEALALIRAEARALTSDSPPRQAAGPAPERLAGG